MLHLRSNSLFVGVLGASIISAGISPQADAQVYSEIRLNGRATSANPSGLPIFGSNIDITQRDGPPSSISKSSSAGPAQLDLSAEFAPGIIRARASGRARSVDLGDGLTGSSDFTGLVQVGTSEELNLAVPGHGVGERATLRYSFYVPGNLSLSPQGSAAGIARVVFGSYFGHFFGQGALSIDGVGQYVVSGADYPGTLNSTLLLKCVAVGDVWRG